MVAFTKEDRNLVIKSLVQGDNDRITISNYFNPDGTVAENAINTFVLNEGKEVTLNLQWAQSNVDGEYHMYNIVEGTDNVELLSIDDEKEFERLCKVVEDLED